jgi:hypothetical protein
MLIPGEGSKQRDVVRTLFIACKDEDRRVIVTLRHLV